MVNRSRKVSRAATHKNPEENPEENPLENQDNETTDSDNIDSEENEFLKNSKLDSFDSDLKEWLVENKYFDCGFVSMLYKYESAITGENKLLAGQWNDRIPSEHEVGLTYGSGRYIMIIRVTQQDGKRKLASRKFKIHSHYDTLKLQDAESKKAGYIPVNTGGAVSSDANSLMMTLGVMERVFAMILPVINRPQDNNVAKILSETYRGVNETMRGQMLDNAQLLNDVMRNKMDVEEVVETENEVSEFHNIINTIAPILEKFMPAILGNGAKSAATIAGIKSLPDYKKIVEDKKMLTGLVKFIQQEKGIDATEKLLKKLKIKKP